MADVGVLNLQIHDNSEQAVQGLDKLTDALARVKTAVSGGLKLGKIATDLERIGKVVDDSIHGSTIVKISQLGEALSQLKGLDNVRITIKDGGNSVQIRDALGNSAQLIDTISQTSQTMASEMTEGFGQAATGVRQATEAYEDMKDRMAEAKGAGNGLDFSVFDPSKLPLDALGMKIDESGQQWRQYGEMVKDSFDTIKNAGALDTVTSSVEEVGRSTMAIIPYNENLENSWERISARMDEAKQKAAEYEAIRKEQEAKFYAEPEKKEYTMAQTNAMADNLTQLDLLKAKLREAEEQYNKFVNALGTDSAKTVAAGLKVSDLRDKIWEYNDALKQANATATTSGLDKVTEYMDASKIDLLTEKYNAMQTALAQDIQNGQVDTQTAIDRAVQIKNLGDQIQNLKEKEDEAASSTHGLRSAFESLKTGIKNLSFVKLLSQFARIAKYRFLRSVIRSITSGFSEGIQNVYNYSKAINSSFAPSMDSAASSLAQMKNSIGAATAPLLQALIPVLQTVVNWFITAINYVNQFIALLNGQTTWTRAVYNTTSAYKDQTKAAKSASAAVKDLLADWDELNIIQSQNSGGGTGSTSAAEDYLKMFEEVSEFENKIKEIVDFIKDNFETIKSIVAGIGAAILAWKISKAFGNTLGFLQSLELAAGLILMIEGVKVTAAAGYDIGKNGLNSDNLLKAIGGIFEIALGAGLVGVAFGGIVGGAIGLTVGATLGLIILGWNMAEGELDALYGDIKLTTDEIQQEVDNLFAFDVNASLKNATVDHDSIESAREEVITSIRDANADYVTFKLKLTPESAATLVASVNKTVDQANALLALFQKKISIGFGFKVNFSDPEFVQQFSTDKISGLEGYITGLGNQIGDILEDGVIDGLDEQRLLEELMTKLTNVTNAIALGKTSGRFAAELERGNYGRDWTTVDRQSAIAYANRYTTQMDAVREDAYYQALDTKSALKGVYYGMLQRNIDEPGTYTDEEIQQAWDNYVNYDMQAAIEDYVEQATAEGREIFRNNMMTVFNSAIEKKMGQGGLDTTKWTTTPGGLRDNANLKDWMNKNMAVNLGWNEDEFAAVMDSMGMNAFDLLEDKMRLRYINTIINALGDNKETYSRLKDELSIPVDEILTVQKSDWDRWGAKSRKAFIANLSQVYGGREVLTGLYNSGFDLGEIVDVGMMFSGSSRDSFFNTIQELYGTDAVQEALNKAGYGYTLLPLFGGESGVENAAEEVSEAIGETVAEDVHDATQEALNNTEPITVGENAGDTVIDETVTQTAAESASDLTESATEASQAAQTINRLTLDDVTLDTTDAVSGANAAASAIEDMVNRIRTAFQELNGMSFSFETGDTTLTGIIRTVIPVQQRASGGFVRSGDLVMANENGNFEMMGKMGNQPVVANNSQIIEGISTGVGNANSGIESRLGSIEDKLARLLNKELVARAEPSSGWGNHAKRSQEAWERVNG